jgi:hypothetical protein
MKKFWEIFENCKRRSGGYIYILADLLWTLGPRQGAMGNDINYLQGTHTRALPGRTHQAHRIIELVERAVLHLHVFGHGLLWAGVCECVPSVNLLYT